MHAWSVHGNAAHVTALSNAGTACLTACAVAHAGVHILLWCTGPRCQLDSAVLPNGKVLIINGVEEGYSGLGYFPVSTGADQQCWACMASLCSWHSVMHSSEINVSTEHDSVHSSALGRMGAAVAVTTGSSCSHHIWRLLHVPHAGMDLTTYSLSY